MIDVKENKDGSFEISWDPNDSSESMFNTWSEQDFIDAIRDHCNSYLKDNESFRESKNL